MHHRVRNNLQTVAALLSLQLRQVEGSEAERHLQDAIGRVQAIASVHDLHILTLSSHCIALYAHLVVESLAHWPAVLAASRHALAEQGITHVTLQPEPLSNAIRWLPAGKTWPQQASEGK